MKLSGEQSGRQRLSLHQDEVQTFAAAGDAPAVVPTVDARLCECMNISTQNRCN